MRHLSIIFKAIIRFFKKNIFSIIGVIFLLFFASASFATLKNTTDNLNKSYSKIVRNGNLHDFVVNERYILGEGADYNIYRKKCETGDVLNPQRKEIIKEDSQGDLELLESDTYVFIEPNIDTWKDGNRTLLDAFNKWLDGGGIKNTSDPNYQLFFDSQSILSEYGIEIDPTLGKHTNTEKIRNIVNLNKVKLNDLTHKFLQQNFIRLALNTGSVLQPFESINLTQNKQGLFYKIIKQTYSSTKEYEKQIDKIVIYNGNNFTSSSEYPFSDFLSSYSGHVKSINPTGNYKNLPAEEKKLLREQGTQFVRLLSKASWSNQKCYEDFNYFIKYLDSNEGKDTDPYFLSESSSSIKDKKILSAYEKFKNIISKNLFNNKGYQIVINDTSGSLGAMPGAPISATITNKRSFEVIVTPEYLKKNNKECISFNKWKSKINTPEEEFNRWFSELSSRHKIKIDEDEYVIVGAGLSPDFMYPVVSFSRPLPNINNEAIVYVNKDGYSKIFDSFRGAETENVLLGKFKKGVNLNNGIQEINKIANEYMAWPSNIKSAYLSDDLSNTLTPASLRVTFIPKIVSGIDAVSSIILVFILISVLIASFILIKRFIDKNKTDLGILLASGYKKWNIIFPLSTIFISFIVIGSIIGYVSGFGLQIVAMDLVSNFWTIPFDLSIFNVVPFVLFIFLIGIVFFLIVWIVAMFVLRGDATLLIDNTATNRINRFSYYMKKIFPDKNPISQLRYSIAFSSLFKMFVLAVMSGILMTATTFSISSTKKFIESQNKTFNARKYNYAIDLCTPTVQGGQYFTVPYDKIGMSLYGLKGWDDPETETGNYNLGQYINDVGPLEGEYDFSSPNLIDKDQLSERGHGHLKNNLIFSKALTEYGTFQLPSAADIKLGYSPTTDLMYLQYDVQSRLLLNASIAGNKPWDIGVKLMPSNQRKYCEQANKNLLSKMSGDTLNIFKTSTGTTMSFRDAIFKYVYKDEKNSTQLTKSDYELDPDVFINQGFDETKEIKYPNSKYLKLDITQVAGILTLKIDYILLMINAFTKPEYAIDNYLMMYSRVPMMPGDRTYSHATFKMNNNSMLPEQKIIGISKRNEQFLNLKNDLGEDLEQKLIDSNIEIGPDNKHIVPIIINKSGAKKNNLSKGDCFDVTISNTIDRKTRNNPLYNIYLTPIGKRIKAKYKHIIVDENNKEDCFDYIRDKYTFKIIDILDTYEGIELYTSQKNINRITGMEVFDTSSELNDFTKKPIGENGIPFNGVFSNNEIPFQVQNTLMLYAESGLNIGNDQALAGFRDLFSETQNISTQPTQPQINRKKAKEVLGYTQDCDDVDTFINNIINTFGKSAYISITGNVTPTNALKDSFVVMNDTIYTIQLFAVSMIIIVSLIIIILLTFILINDSLKISSLLKAFGLTDIKNALSLLLIYIPVIIIATLMSIPITLLFSSFYIDIMFEFAGILLEIPILWWHVVISGSIVLIVFLLAFSAILFQLKKQNLANEIKNN